MAAGNSPCASCKLLRRRCAKECIFAPYFSSDEPHKFAIVHKVFGASNVSKMLQVTPQHLYLKDVTSVCLFHASTWNRQIDDLPVSKRGDAVSSMVYEANARMRDPVYGCVGAISYLQTQVSQLQVQLAIAKADILCIQMQQDSGAPAVSPNGVLPPYPAYTNMFTDDVVSRVSSDDISYSCMHNTSINHHHHHHQHQHEEQYLSFACNNEVQYETIKRESSSLWA